jgi:hypothetical protein
MICAIFSIIALAGVEAATLPAEPVQPAPTIAYVPVLGAADDEPSVPRIVLSASPSPNPAPTIRALRPIDADAAALADGDGPGTRRGKVQLLDGGKLLLTNGVSTVEGSSGGGIARWATIGGRQMLGGIGLAAHGTAIELADYGWRSYGVLLGVGDRVELSLARADFDTRDIGALLGIGRGYTFNLDTFGAKLRVAGDVVYGEPWLPQIAVGIEHKRSRDGALVRALGAADDEGTDYTISATKLVLARSLLINATLRYTEANELGLLGFGSAGDGYRLQVEGSLGYQLSRRAVVGAEYRTKPDNLGLGESDWLDVFAAYALTDHLTLTAAYVDLGTIATIPDQRGGLLSAQVAF